MRHFIESKYANGDITYYWDTRVFYSDIDIICSFYVNGYEKRNKLLLFINHTICFG